MPHTTTIFVLDEVQKKKLKDWIKNKPHSEAIISDQYTFCFTPTGMGCIIKVRCAVTKQEVDLTNYEAW